MRRVGKISIGALEKREGEEDVLMRNDGVTTERQKERQFVSLLHTLTHSVW